VYLPVLCVAVWQGRVFARDLRGCLARACIYPRLVWLFGKGIEGLRRKLYRTAMCHLTLQKFLSAPGLIEGFML
jgi:hypothetical protein